MSDHSNPNFVYKSPPDGKYPNRPSRETNPSNAPTGPFTGRCSKCGSNDLWDDCTWYGCNNCGATFPN